MIRTGQGTVIAREYDVADGFLSRARGLMFRRSLSDDYALVFEFSTERRVSLHMLFVPFDIDVIFTDSEGVVTDVRTLSAWKGTASSRAVTVIETNAGSAEDVEKGDVVIID